MKKAIVIGSPGAGKSTFARNLRDITGLPLYYLDRIWHLPDRTTVTRAEFDASLAEILERSEWIIDGNYSRTLEVRIRACDTVFLLDYPLDVCLDGIRERVGKKREEMPWTEEELDEEFFEYVKAFPEDQMPEIYRLLEMYKGGRQIHVFRSRKEADAFLRKCEESDALPRIAE